MRVALSDDEKELARSFRQTLEKECPPSLVRELQSTGEAKAERLWRILGDIGVFGLALPTEFGGGGAGLFELGLFYEQAGRVLCPTLVYSTLAFSLALARLGTDEQRMRWLTPIAAGDLTAALCLWDASDNGDFSPALTAQPRGDSWVLSGVLDFVDNADSADIVMVAASASGGGPSRTICALIDPRVDGWNTTRHKTFSRDNQCQVVVEDVIVGTGEIIDPSDAGIDPHDLIWVSNAVTGLQCMEMVGGALAVIERTVDYVKGRHQFGRPIASFQAVQHHVANMHIAIDGARLTSYQSVWLVDRGKLAQRETAIAKLKCNEAYKFATLTAHQLHGGMGYLRETDLHLWSQRAKATELLGGAWDVQLAHLEEALRLAG
jgi:alkylation response protein AidB-like acyl-CoA dehydrogenase